MKITTVFNNYFPPTVIEVIKWGNGDYQNQTEYRIPENGIYPSYVVGVWRVTYKTINPNYYCEGQLAAKKE